MNGEGVQAGARFNLRQLSGGRQLDFTNQEFVFPPGARDADGNLGEKKVERSLEESSERTGKVTRLADLPF